MRNIGERDLFVQISSKKQFHFKGRRLSLQVMLSVRRSELCEWVLLVLLRLSFQKAPHHLFILSRLSVPKISKQEGQKHA